MGSSSVTGFGLGMSHGMHKCANQCGGCGCKCADEPEPTTTTRRGCVKKLSVGQKNTYKTSSGRSGIKIC
jgi:hypothetical protein